MARKQREVSFDRTPAIRAQFRALRVEYPKIDETIKVFNEYKREIPPRDLPGKMKDHALKGKLKGIRECHLDDDVLLLYTHKNDIVFMLYICQHEDLYGQRGRQIAAYISDFIH